jgi:hypothetical protein
MKVIVEEIENVLGGGVQIRVASRVNIYCVGYWDGSLIISCEGWNVFREGHVL